MNCFFCGGELKESCTSHIVEYEGCVIVIRNVPCEECLQCGETFYSNSVATKLEEIVSELKKIVSAVAVVEYEKFVA